MPGRLVSENFLFDSLSALSLLIAFYYGLTGLACAIYWRRELFKSAKNLIFIGIAPLIGAGMLFYLLVESARDLADPKASYSGTELFGFGMPLGIAIVFVALGFILMVAWRSFGPPASREFFARRALVRAPRRRDRRSGQGRGDRGLRGGCRRRYGFAREERVMHTRAMVVGYDGSDCAKAALEAAIHFAGTAGDRIVIGFGYEPGSYGEEHSAHREEVRKFGERATAPAVERAGEAGVEASLALIGERPVDALVTLAAEHNARAIVVGTHGESPIRGAILGSTPHKLLQVAKCPVLVVPVPE